MSGSTGRASIELLAPAAIVAAVWDEIWHLSCRFYAAERSYVETRLRQHQRIALYRSADGGELVGMAAIEIDAFEFDGRRVLALFTSHAIVEEAYRGQNLLQRTGLRIYLRNWLRHALHRKFWVYDTFSYRSYLLLPRNLREFWPRRERPTPAWEAALMADYGQRKYGSAWQGDGVVRRVPEKRLLPQTATLRPELLSHPDVAYFDRVNPGHAEGDMLLCLVPLTLANWWGILSHAALRAWRRGAADRR